MRLAFLLLTLPLAAQNPAHTFGIGAGYHHGVSAWMNGCAKSSERVYLCGAQDLNRGVVSTRAGIETIVIQAGIFALTVKADAGLATNQLNTGGSYGTGGSVVFNFGRRAPTWYLVASGSRLTNNVGIPRPSDYVARIGFMRSF